MPGCLIIGLCYSPKQAFAPALSSGPLCVRAHHKDNRLLLCDRDACLERGGGKETFSLRHSLYYLSLSHTRTFTLIACQSSLSSLSKPIFNKARKNLQSSFQRSANAWFTESIPLDIWITFPCTVYVSTGLLGLSPAKQNIYFSGTNDLAQRAAVCCCNPSWSIVFFSVSTWPELPL